MVIITQKFNFFSLSCRKPLSPKAFIYQTNSLFLLPSIGLFLSSCDNTRIVTRIPFTCLVPWLDDLKGGLHWSHLPGHLQFSLSVWPGLPKAWQLGSARGTPRRGGCLESSLRSHRTSLQPCSTYSNSQTQGPGLSPHHSLRLSKIWALCFKTPIPLVAFPECV